MNTMNNKTKKLLIISIACLIVLALLIGIAGSMEGNKQPAAADSSLNSESTVSAASVEESALESHEESFVAESVVSDSSAAQESIDESSSESSSESSVAESAEITETPSPTPEQSGTSGSSGNNSGSSSAGSSSSPKPAATPTVIKEITPTPISTISFPYEIPGTNLVVEQISPYSGFYVEDVSDDKVSNIAAIVLKNNGGPLEFVGIGISQGTRSLAFTGSEIPAGAAVIIQEQNRAVFSDDPYYSCTANTTEVESFEMSEDRVSVTEEENGSLTIANLTQETIPTVVVYYKNYLSEDDVYVGGVTYRITIHDLAPGALTNGVSGHYLPGMSVILKVTTEE